MSTAYGGPAYALRILKNQLEKENLPVDIAAVGDIEKDQNLFSQRPDTGKISIFSYDFPRVYFFSKALWRWLAEKIPGYDLVHIHSVFTFPAAAAAFFCQKYRKPYIVRPFGMLDKVCMSRHALRKRIYFPLIEKRNLQRAEIIHCTSQSEAEEISRFHLKLKTLVLPLGLDFGEMDNVHGMTRSENRILFLSRIDPKKGLEVLLKAFGMLKERKQNAVLYIAGSGQAGYVSEIHKLAVTFGLEDAVKFLGEVRGEEKKKLLNESAMFVLPSKRENFGLSAAEALAAGCPVVISDEVAIHKEVSEYQAGLVVPADPVEISGAMEQMLSNSALREKMGLNGQRLAREKFNIEIIAKEMIKTYESLL